MGRVWQLEDVIMAAETQWEAGNRPVRYDQERGRGILVTSEGVTFEVSTAVFFILVGFQTKDENE